MQINLMLQSKVAATFDERSRAFLDNQGDAKL